MEDTLVVDQFMTGAADVVDDFVVPAFDQRCADAWSEVVEHGVPGDAFPFALAAFAGAPQGIENALGVIDLVEGGGPFGAVASAAAGMGGVALELADEVGLLVDVGDQAASRLAVEAYRRDYRIMLFGLARPLRGIVLDPVVPAFDGREAGEPAGGS